MVGPMGQSAPANLPVELTVLVHQSWFINIHCLFDLKLIYIFILISYFFLFFSPSPVFSQVRNFLFLEMAREDRVSCHPSPPTLPNQLLPMRCIGEWGATTPPYIAISARFLPKVLFYSLLVTLYIYTHVYILSTRAFNNRADILSCEYGLLRGQKHDISSNLYNNQSITYL